MPRVAVLPLLNTTPPSPPTYGSAGERIQTDLGKVLKRHLFGGGAARLVLEVEVLHEAQRDLGLRPQLGHAPEVVVHLLRQRQQHRLVAQPVEVLVCVGVDDLGVGGRG